MRNQVEEIVLLSTEDGQRRREARGSSHPRKTATNDCLSDEQPSSVFFRLIKPTNRISFYQHLLLWVVLFGCLFLLAGPLALHFSYVLPSIKARTVPPHDFSEERARDYYPNLTQHGPRVSNTRADYLTRAFLISQIARIQSKAQTSVHFELSLQNFTADNIENLQNIAVRLSNVNTSSSNMPCLMLVAHYDSVEFSPGGSDDGSGVVILLEVLSNLVHDAMVTFSQVHLIVLWTSAEEMSLQGAKAFVQSHQWKNDIRRFINIDSTGGHEKAILFRVKPSQLIRDYRRVPRPHANVIGDEILELTESDTDYSIFTKEGSLLGYDFAFYLDGYNYHTLLDQPSIVEDGALQHLGENVLALSREILLGRVNLQLPESITDDDNLIYFDILGRHLVTYGKTTSVIIQLTLISFVVLIGLIVIIVDHLWYAKHSSTDDVCSVYFYFKYPLLIRILFINIFFICYLISMIIGILFPVLIAFIISKIRPLSWYGNATLAFFLYGLPCLIGIILSEALWTCFRRFCLSKYPKTNPMEMKTIYHIDRLCFNFERHWALLLVFVLLMSISIVVGYRSLYLILLWSFFICLIYGPLILFDFIRHWRQMKFLVLFNDQGWHWMFAPYLVSLIPLIHTFEMTSRLVRLAIPIMGARSHSIPVPQDLLICALIVLPAVLFFLTFIPNIQRTMNYSRTLIVLTVSFLIVVVIACTRQPFTRTHPKVVKIQHTSQTIYQITDPTHGPVTIPIYSHTASITVESLDSLVLSPTLDRIAQQTGYVLHNRNCPTKSECSFDDAFNRTIAFQNVELTEMQNSYNYRFTVRHLPSYQIQVSVSPVVKFVVQNASMKPRTETIVDIQALSLSSPFSLEITLNRCDLADSPFLVALTRKLPEIVMWGKGHCGTIADTLLLAVRRQ